MDMEAIINRTMEVVRSEAGTLGQEAEWGGNAVLMGNFKNQDRLPVVWIEMTTWAPSTQVTAWYWINSEDVLQSADTLEEALDISGLES